MKPCLYGLAACFAGTFMSLAAADGVVLRSLRVVAENQVDLTRPMGLGDRPLVERVSLWVGRRPWAGPLAAA